MRFRSKRFKKMIPPSERKTLPLAEAVDQIKDWGNTKFDQSVECVIQLGIDTRHAEQAVRGAISFPHGIGKMLRVIAFCEGEDAEAAQAAGASEVGGDELVEKIQGGWLDFDVAVAHPRMMSKVGKLGRILGPQGKMPSPKGGTVTANVGAAVTDYAAGKVEFRNDSGGNVHALVGKVSFDPAKLVDNIDAFIDTIKRMKPAAAKGAYIKKVCICATMSPAVQVEIT